MHTNTYVQRSRGESRERRSGPGTGDTGLPSFSIGRYVLPEVQAEYMNRTRQRNSLGPDEDANSNVELNRSPWFIEYVDSCDVASALAISMSTRGSRRALERKVDRVAEDVREILHAALVAPETLELPINDELEIAENSVDHHLLRLEVQIAAKPIHPAGKESDGRGWISLQLNQFDERLVSSVNGVKSILAAGHSAVAGVGSAIDSDRLASQHLPVVNSLSRENPSTFGTKSTAPRLPIQRSNFDVGLGPVIVRPSGAEYSEDYLHG